ncbi:SMI1/KNR4 family protein [Actinopolyspora mortivallis]|uniref:SMI1/KNR4 family protein n=1 Tax=Actinopolyspora mortivallis TaxID=33906 RepID=UPI0003740A24|nr:SMI1/KNR4 family protein [Actinopolyspora mortivallis]
MSRYVERLKSLVALPEVSLPEVNWAEVERFLGVTLPSDYKEFMETYGPGAFDDEIILVDPRSASEDSHLLDLWKREVDAFLFLKGKVSTPFWISDPERTLLPWAYTPNSDAFFWLMDPVEDPDQWPVVLRDEEFEWFYFPGSMTRFLVSVLSGDIYSELDEIDPEFFVNLSPVGQSYFSPGDTV